MELTRSDDIDVAASAQKHAEITQLVSAIHSLSGCDTVGQLHGIGKGTAIKSLEAGYRFVKLGNLDTDVP